jgi:hypothetical protein
MPACTRQPFGQPHRPQTTVAILTPPVGGMGGQGGLPAGGPAGSPGASSGALTGAEDGSMESRAPPAGELRGARSAVASGCRAAAWGCAERSGAGTRRPDPQQSSAPSHVGRRRSRLSRSRGRDASGGRRSGHLASSRSRRVVDGERPRSPGSACPARAAETSPAPAYLMQAARGASASGRWPTGPARRPAGPRRCRPLPPMADGDSERIPRRCSDLMSVLGVRSSAQPGPKEAGGREGVHPGWREGPGIPASTADPAVNDEERAQVPGIHGRWPRRFTMSVNDIINAIIVLP